MHGSLRNGLSIKFSILPSPKLIAMKSTPLIWFDADDDSLECSFCHGRIDPLKHPVVVRDRNNETLARFHADCYESYFNSACRYQELAEAVDWMEPFRRYFSKW